MPLRTPGDSHDNTLPSLLFLGACGMGTSASTGCCSDNLNPNPLWNGGLSQPSIPFTHRSTHPRPTCLPNLKKHLKQVRQAATHGAASITKVRQIIADAADSAVARFGEAILRGKPVEDWSAWAFRVGANAAKVIGAAGRRRGETALPPNLTIARSSTPELAESRTESGRRCAPRFSQIRLDRSTGRSAPQAHGAKHVLTPRSAGNWDGPHCTAQVAQGGNGAVGEAPANPTPPLIIRSRASSSLRTLFQQGNRCANRTTGNYL